MNRLNYLRKKQRLYFFLLVLMIIFIVIGIFIIACLSKDNKLLIKNNLSDFFMAIKSNKLNYHKALVSSLSTNIITSLIIWLLGVSLIGFPIVIIFYIFKCLTIGMSISAIIYFYSYKGFFMALIYIIPSIINLGILIVLCYYSLRVTYHLYELLFLKREVYFRKVMKRYLKVGLVSIVLFIFSSFIEVYIVPSILKIFV